MRAIVTDEQRRSRPEAGLPSIVEMGLEAGDFHRAFSTQKNEGKQGSEPQGQQGRTVAKKRKGFGLGQIQESGRFDRGFFHDRIHR